MFVNIIYVLATLNLLLGSVLSFNNNFSDYFFIIGSSLFFLKAFICLFNEAKNSKKDDYSEFFNSNIDY